MKPHAPMGELRIHMLRCMRGVATGALRDVLQEVQDENKGCIEVSSGGAPSATVPATTPPSPPTSPQAHSASGPAEVLQKALQAGKLDAAAVRAALSQRQGPAQPEAATPSRVLATTEEASTTGSHQSGGSCAGGPQTRPAQDPSPQQQHPSDFPLGYPSAGMPSAALPIATGVVASAPRPTTSPALPQSLPRGSGSGNVYGLLTALSRRERRAGELMALVQEAEGQLAARDEQCRHITTLVDSARQDLAQLHLEIESRQHAMKAAVRRQSALEAQRLEPSMRTNVNIKEDEMTKMLSGTGRPSAQSDFSTRVPSHGTSRGRFESFGSQ